MSEEKKETILIPRLQKIISNKFSFKKRAFNIFFLFLIVLLYAGLLILISYLPITQGLKIISLVIGSFILEDILHFLKKIWTNQQTL